MKSRRKLLSILLTLSLLVTLLVPMVGPAAAATTYTMSNVKTVSLSPTGSTTTFTTGTLTIDIPSLTTASYVYMSLPSSPPNFSFNNLALQIPTNVEGNTNAVDTNSNNTYISVISPRLVQIHVGVNSSAVGNPGRLVVGSNINSVFGGMNITCPNGISGEIKVTMAAPSSQVFSAGDIVVAKVGTGTVTVSTENVPNLGSAGSQYDPSRSIDTRVTIGIKEGTDLALVTGTNSLKFTLPPGFAWRHNAQFDTVYWGNTTGLDFDYGNNDRDLIITNVADAYGNNLNSSGSYFTIKAYITIDESVAKTGDVVATIGGDSTATPSTLTVAKYGDYSAKVAAVEKNKVYAGKGDQKLGRFSIEETLASSLVPGRTITLTLPAGAKWTNYPTLDADQSLNYGNINLSDWTAVGNDGRMIKKTVNSNSGTEPAKLVFKDAKIITGPDFGKGDFKVTIGGTAGASGDVLIGEMSPLVTASSDGTAEVKIGMPDQAVSDFTIVETAAGNINSNAAYSSQDAFGKVTTTASRDQARLVIEAPLGVTFTSTPKVEVTDGDLQIDANGIKVDTGNDRWVIIPIKSTSTKASTIKVSNIRVTVDRTVPEGPMVFKVKDTAVNESLASANSTVTVNLGNNQTATVTTTSGQYTDSIFPGSVTAASAIVAKCVTPAPVTTKATAIFKIGDTKFTLNGVEQTMDAAPYLKNGRTYLPLRFVAKAVGVPDSNILWNSDDQTVVLIKDSSVVKLTIGSNTMYINGTPITMDVAPEIVDPGRTMLPVRWVGQALGCTISWDNATQTVTVN